MSRLESAGIGVEVPPGWEGSISGGRFPLLENGANQPTLLHLGSFPLPPHRGSFGSGAVELMNSQDVLMILFEYGPESADTPLFAMRGIPRPLAPDEFERDNLQRTLLGQSGLQRFFTEKSRPFCLYVVLGSHIDRAVLVNRVNVVLATLEIT